MGRFPHTHTRRKNDTHVGPNTNSNTKYGTAAAAHVKGTSVRVVNPTVADNTVAQDDNALIEEGDDFGFSGSIT